MWMDRWLLETPFEYWFKDPHGSNITNHRFLFRCFTIKKPVVVLSNSNNLSSEVNTQACREYNIPILRRKGGGGTVLLDEGTIVLTLGFYAKHLFNNALYFSMINQIWAEAIHQCTSLNLAQNGYSDLCIGNKKVVGTSLFRSRHFALYQGSLLLDANFSIMEDVLKHPSREPEYRQKRTHREFLTTLKEEGYTGTGEELANFCQKWIYENFFHYMKEHMNNDINAMIF